MQSSRNGRHLLGGVGDGRIYIDGRVPPGLELVRAGGAAWLDDDLIVFNAWRDGAWCVTGYDLSTGRVHALDDRGASNLYAGAGRWLAFLADGKTGSFDSEGHSWPDRVAIGMSPEGDQLFTNPERNGLIIRHPDGQEERFNTGPIADVRMQGGVILYESGDTLRAIGASDPVSPIGEEIARFATRPNGSRWLVSWNEANHTTALYPWQTSGRLMGYALSRDEHDFNPDIAVRDDGLLVVGTGVNQGETGQRLYEIDLAGQQMRRDGGDWQPLELVDLSNAPVPAPAPPEPIIQIGRPLWMGWYTFTEPSSDLPRNCDLRVDRAASYLIVGALGGAPLFAYAAAVHDSDVDELDAVIQDVKTHNPGLPVVAYYTAQAAMGRLPKSADVLGVEAYCHADESIDQFERRMRATIARAERVVLIAQAYTSNARNTQDLRSLVPVFAGLAHDCRNVEGILAFSGAGRATGWQDHPEIHEGWRQLFAGIPGAPNVDAHVPSPAPTPDPESPGPTSTPHPVPPPLPIDDAFVVVSAAFPF